MPAGGACSLGSPQRFVLELECGAAGGQADDFNVVPWNASGAVKAFGERLFGSPAPGHCVDVIDARRDLRELPWAQNALFEAAIVFGQGRAHALYRTHICAQAYNHLRDQTG